VRHPHDRGLHHVRETIPFARMMERITP